MPESKSAYRSKSAEVRSRNLLIDEISYYSIRYKSVMSVELFGAARPCFSPGRSVIRFRMDRKLAALVLPDIRQWRQDIRKGVDGKKKSVRLTAVMLEEDIDGGQVHLTFGSSNTKFSDAEGLRNRLISELAEKPLPEPLSATIILKSDATVSLINLPLALFTLLREMGLDGVPLAAPAGMGEASISSKSIVGGFGFTYPLGEGTNLTLGFIAAVWYHKMEDNPDRYRLMSPGKFILVTVGLQNDADRMRLEGHNYLETGIRHVVNILGKSPFKLRLDQETRSLQMDVPQPAEYDQTIPASLGLEPDFSIVIPA